MPLVPLALRRDPVDVLACLAAEPGSFCLEVPDDARPLAVLGCRPHAVLTIDADGRATRSDGAAVSADPLAAIERFVAGAPGDSSLPFPLGGVTVGHLAYELGHAIEPAVGPCPAGVGPLAVLAHHDPLLVYDRSRGQWLVASATPSRARAPWLERLATSPPIWKGTLGAAALAPVLPPSWHRAAVERVLSYLHAGDVYQVNVTQPWRAPLTAPPWALFARLARRHPVPYAGYLDAGHATLVANSPERFLRVRGRHVDTRPIKGTRPRGEAPAVDLALAAELAIDAKERAEHVMILDLERNDLGRVAVTGSVVVREHARVETHQTVHHLVSTVAATLRPEVGLAALLRATFPGGSITGAPKVRAMQVIRELEPAPRGAYTGAFGLFGRDGDLELGLAIRTAVVRDGVLEYHAGGGIVVDSDREREHAEAWLKTAALRLALADDADPALDECSSG